MATYFGIDLGTTQTLIAKYQSYTYSLEGRSPFELIPFFYDNYKYDCEKEEYRPNINADGEYDSISLIMPSVLYLDERVKANGKSYTYRLVGEAAQKRVTELNDLGSKFYTNAKAKLESNCQADENGITASDIAYELLKTCFCSIKKYMYKNSQKTKLVIQRKMDNVMFGVSTPLATNSEFSNVLIEQARRAAADVGFNRVDERIHLVEEPTAALVNYITSELRGKKSICMQKEMSNIPQEGIAMVIDLGGGTTDVAVRPFRLAEKSNRIIPEFIDELHSKSKCVVRRADNARAAFGGLDFDDRLAAYLVYMFSEYYQNKGFRSLCYGTLSEFDGEIRFREEIPLATRVYIISIATNMARTMKEAFTDINHKEHRFPDIYRLKGPDDNSTISISVKREKYKELIQPLLENEAAHQFLPGIQSETIEHIVTQTVLDAGIQHLSDLAFVYLTGGTSMMPEVRGWVERYIGDNCPIIWANDRPFEESFQNCLTDIANGISLLLDKRADSTPYRQSISNAVMIDLQDGLPQVLIEAGTQCPNSGELKDVMSVESVVGIGVRLYSAKDAYSPDLKILGEYRIDKRKVIPPGTMLSFRYSLDIDKQISLTAFYRNDQGRESEARLDLKRLE